MKINKLLRAAWRAAQYGTRPPTDSGPPPATATEPQTAPPPRCMACHDAGCAECDEQAQPGSAEMALRMEVQQLRLMKTPEGNEELAGRLRQCQEDRAALGERVTQLQRANESLCEELRSARSGAERPRAWERAAPEADGAPRSTTGGA